MKNRSWVRKGKKPYYGYKTHVVVDTKEGFILNGHVTPAHVADTTEFENLMENLFLGLMLFFRAENCP